jgi:hypothetical protein
LQELLAIWTPPSPPQRWNISRSACPELEERTAFAGSYNKFECGLHVREARTGDSGIWGCEMVRSLWPHGVYHNASCRSHISLVVAAALALWPEEAWRYVGRPLLNNLIPITRSGHSDAADNDHNHD